MLNKLRREVGRWSGKIYALAICTLLALIGLIGTWGVIETARAAGIDVGANPTPKVDIAVTVPSDYPGTFLDFKAELTQKLIDQGMDPSAFRITDTATKIDTTDQSSWVVYDHYYNQAEYNKLGYTADQMTTHPFRAADNSCTSGGVIPMSSIFGGGGTTNSCRNFITHTYSYEDQGKANMVFAGYGTSALVDFMYYPATSNSRRTVSFDLDASVIDKHTLQGAGFLLNAGISGGILNGYVFYIIPRGEGTNIKRTADAYIYKLNNFSAMGSTSVGGTLLSQTTIDLGAAKKLRISVDLNETKVTVQSQPYDASGNLIGLQPTNNFLDIALEKNGYNGFGPIVGYGGHGCSSLTVFKYLDLEMKFETSAFEALKKTQFYQGAEQKYFINLAGDNNNPQIPDEFNKDGSVNKDYSDGVNRLNENEIFYISNAQDGKVVTDSTKNANGDTTHQGLGAENGFIAMGDDPVAEMAEWIYKGYQEGRKFKQAEIKSDLPLANFYLTNAEDGSQLMTVHLQHLVNTNGTIRVNMFDKSVVGSLAGADGYLAKYHWVVYDPNNRVVFQKDYAKASDIEDYVFTKDSASGTWVFELTVTDNKGNESKVSQTYVTAYLDNEYPYIQGENTGRNEATITLTDTGQGIDEDGITFIEDGRGSGVEAYWVTNDLNASPKDEDWEMLPFAQHQYSFDITVNSTDPIVVWVRDECGNVGNKAVFQPTHVRVEDADGNPIDDYYTIEEKPIVYLPEEDILPDPEDPEDKFSGWTVTGGDNPTPGPITEGSDVPKENEHEIVIRPNYSKDQAILVYLPNGGEFAASDVSRATAPVSRNSSIIKDVTTRDLKPTRKGYTFTGWKYLKNYNNGDKATAEQRAANANNLADVTDQTATASENRGTMFVDGDYHYLVAQWEVAKNTVKLDANGGSLGTVRSFEDIAYDTDLGSLALPVSGREIPKKPGYIFQGWSTTKNAMDNTANTIKVAQGVSGITTVPAPKMDDKDMTLYAVWKEDKDKFVVSFDSAGGSRVSDVAYQTAVTNKYSDNQSQGFTFRVPARPGYDFAGWYLKNADGTVGTTEYKGTEAIAVNPKASHTFVAKWTPRDDTKYTVEYWVNTGKKDDDGKPVYAKASDASLTKTYTGTTEKTATVPEGDKTPEIKVDGKSYWYNPEASGNEFTGTITGSPNLILKVCYDRYLDVNVTKNIEEGGTVTSATQQKEGSKPTVSWKAADGYHVKQIKVDGVVHDDLALNEGSYTTPEGLQDNVKVEVVFEKDASGSNGGGSTPTPTPTPTPKPNPNPEKTFYQIRTRVEGTTDPDECTITPSTTVKGTDDAKVEWSLRENSRYSVVKVEVDGVAYDTSKTSVDFKKVTDNHDVVVTVKALPSLGGETTAIDKYTVTVNRYGGDDKVTTSQTQTVEKGKSGLVTWDATGSPKWKVVKVVLDNEDITDLLGGVDNIQKSNIGMSNKGGALATLKAVDRNHVVDIYLAEATDDNSDPVIPDYTDPAKFVTITTKLVGADGDITGTITGGAVMPKDENGNYVVNWQLNSTNTKNATTLEERDGYFYSMNSKDDPGYVCYEIEKVIVDNVEQMKDTSGKVEIPTEKDHDVQIVVKPVLHKVTILRYGDGTVSPSKSVYHLGDYKGIEAKPGSGSKLVKVVINGEVKFDDTENTNFVSSEPATQSEEPKSDDSSDTKVAPENTPAPQKAPSKAPAQQAVPEATESATSDSEVTEESGAGKVEVQTDEVEGDKAIGNLDGTEDVENDSAATETLAMALTKNFHMVKDIYRSGSSNLRTVADFTQEEMDRIDVAQDQTIEVYFVKQATDPEGNPVTNEKGEPVYEPLPDPSELVTVSATIEGGEGTIEGVETLKKGGDSTLVVEPGGSYEVVSAEDQYGNKYELGKKGGTIEIKGVDKDINITVKLQRPTVPNNDPREPDPVFKKDGEGKPVDPVYHVITASTQGGLGWITGSGNVPEGGSRTIKWGPKGDEKVKYVYIDGVSHPELVALGNEGQYTFDDVKADHFITVSFDTNPTNIDTDGDDEPDVNVDPDHDGEPDTNVDTDGDGVPDVNIDPDGDGDPDINVDTDGDGWPDINIDTDGDGKADKNVDTNGDRVYDWKDEGHPNHQDYINSLKGKDDANGGNGGNGGKSGTGLPNTGGSTSSTSTRSWSLGNGAFGFLPKTGDVASMAGIAATLAGMALGATALVSRKRKK